MSCYDQIHHACQRRESLKNNNENVQEKNIPLSEFRVEKLQTPKLFQGKLNSFCIKNDIFWHIVKP